MGFIQSKGLTKSNLVTIISLVSVVAPKFVQSCHADRYLG